VGQFQVVSKITVTRRHTWLSILSTNPSWPSPLTVGLLPFQKDVSRKPDAHQLVDPVWDCTCPTVPTFPPRPPSLDHNTVLGLTLKVYMLKFLINLLSYPYLQHRLNTASIATASTGRASTGFASTGPPRTASVRSTLPRSAQPQTAPPTVPPCRSS